MPPKAVVNAKVIVGHEVVSGVTLLFDRKVIAVGNDISLHGLEVIDAAGMYVSPGFIDIHIHGSGGADVMDGTPQALETICKTVPQTPHTAWLDAYADVVRMITLAPEVPGGMDFVRECMRKYEHIILSIGHSEADYAESMAGFDAGISHVTHLFNAMPPYHHREPGLVQQMKRENLILITDAMRAGCMRCGTYDLGGREVTVSGNRAVLEDGTLAGSVLRMNEALRHMRDHTGISLTEAIASVTLVPARKLRISKGELKSGYDADFVIFDEDFSIISTIVAGEVVYQRSV